MEFDPKAFVKKLRSGEDADLGELRESLRRFGWVKYLPAIIDENDVVLVGNRRLKAAKAERIEPVILRITLGQGNEADAERLKIALASNIASAPLTKEDRKRIAMYLYGKQEWTMQRIAEALGVNQRTISRDLEGLDTMPKPSRPKGGRPKANTLQPERRKNTSTNAQTAARSILDEGKPYPAVERETGLSNIVLRSAVAREEGRREAELTVTPDMLSMTAQEKLSTAIRQHKRKLDIDFNQRVMEEVRRRLNEVTLPHYAKQLEELERSVQSRKGIMDRITYRKILTCLHAERIAQLVAIPYTDLDHNLIKRYNEAFALFTELEKRVLDERQSPTEFRRMPRTYEELMAMKAKVQAQRRAKRASKSSVVAR